jgi:hypothetical protein
MPTVAQKITFAELRSQGVRGLLVYCQDYRYHNVSMNGDRWPDDIRLSDIEDRFICTACRKPGADIRGDPDWDKPGALTSRCIRLR